MRLNFSGAAGVTMADDFFSLPSTSVQRTRMLEFNIQYNDRMIHLKVNSTRILDNLDET